MLIAAICRATVGSAAIVRDLLDRNAQFLQDHLPANVQVVRLPMPSNCPRHTCRGRCCATDLSRYRDCNDTCIDSDSFVRAVLLKCACVLAERERERVRECVCACLCVCVCQRVALCG